MSYKTGQWVESEIAISDPIRRINNIINLGTRLGKYWMNEPITLDFKVTNKEWNCHDNLIFLKSYVKYEPILIITKVPRNQIGSTLPDDRSEFKFSCLQFIATTRYNNKELAEVKSSINKYSSIHSKKGKKILTEAKKTSETSNSDYRLNSETENSPASSNQFGNAFSSAIPPPSHPIPLTGFNANPSGNYPSSTHISQRVSGNEQQGNPLIPNNWIPQMLPYNNYPYPMFLPTFYTPAYLQNMYNQQVQPQGNTPFPYPHYPSSQ
ncbi:hypothetical protein GCK72_001606 [Caenorhabditis remanei]|uniref:T-box domain-containing protein n=1 Tax=Caenorhabditis remanei TaxID=31234 RepID=A0A6A5HQ19_CAERE|nr:hypothetical protein GCK72_001606 [Caenorhabditis remanei]KAF1769789.1 hypothetical protein GCK72_001606 [Caenorhabditis remanei]